MSSKMDICVGYSNISGICMRGIGEQSRLSNSCNIKGMIIELITSHNLEDGGGYQSSSVIYMQTILYTRIEKYTVTKVRSRAYVLSNPCNTHSQRTPLSKLPIISQAGALESKSRYSSVPFQAPPLPTIPLSLPIQLLEYSH
jgi:hypothetical protein